MCFISAGLYSHVKSWKDRKERTETDGGEVVGQRVKKLEEEGAVSANVK